MKFKEHDRVRVKSTRKLPSSCGFLHDRRPNAGIGRVWRVKCDDGVRRAFYEGSLVIARPRRSRNPGLRRRSNLRFMARAGWSA